MSPELQDKFNSVMNLTGLLIRASGTPSFMSLASQNVIKSTNGLLHSLLIGGTSMPSMTIYDSASFASGTVIAQFNNNLPVGAMIIDTNFLNGLVISFSATTVPVVVTAITR